MNDEERSRLLLDQEKTQQKIDKIRSKLFTIGQMLKPIAHAMLSQPENIIITDGPEDLTKAPSPENPVFCNWNEFPKIDEIARLLKDLRDEQHRLFHIERSVKDPNRI